MLLEIAIPIKFENVSRAMTAIEIWQKVWYMFRVFVLLVKPVAYSFAHFHCRCGCPELASSVFMQNNSWYVAILTGKPTINDGKCTMKSTPALHLPWGSEWTSRGEGRGDMPKITSLSQTSKEYHMNGLTLDRTVKTDVELLLEGQLI